MLRFSTREAAKKLGLSPTAVSRYIRLGKIPAPQIVQTGGFPVHLWAEADIERVRKLLPKIKNGRKTRYQKQKNKPQAKQPVPHKKKK